MRTLHLKLTKPIEEGWKDKLSNNEDLLDYTFKLQMNKPFLENVDDDYDPRCLFWNQNFNGWSVWKLPFKHMQERKGKWKFLHLIDALKLQL